MKQSRLAGVMNTFSYLFLAGSLFNVEVAHGAVIQWTLNAVEFDDGGTASGSFFYDADTNIFTNVSITTTNGSDLSGASYELFSPDSDADNLFLVDNAAPTRKFNINLASVLTNAGGSVNLLTAPPPTALEGLCGNSACDLFSNARYVISGSVVSAVPVPAAVWLFGSGLLGLIGISRRKKSA